MKAFVTGGTGFLGSRLIPELLQRGYQVHALVRSDRAATAFEASGVYPVRGDILDVDSMRDEMRKSDVVFHLAGWYKIGARDQSQAKIINVDGTRNVLELADRLGVPKIIYVSTVGVFGDTHGRLVDENYVMPPYQEFVTEYDRTKWMAHYEVALPLIRQGAPVIIAIPGAVYGPGDPSVIGSLMRLYYAGLMPVVPGPELLLTYAHVDDIAAGLVLAAEKGEAGEKYILAGPALPLNQMMNLWAYILKRKPPRIQVPARYLRPLIPLVEKLNSFISLPEIISSDTLRILEVSYAARSDKAKRELGWEPRPLEDGMRRTFDSISRSSRTYPLVSLDQRERAGVALAIAIALLSIWLRRKRRN
jgi:nucleoside-diphosphate-sugar epimerase